jgi:hypothetical protein
MFIISRFLNTRSETQVPQTTQKPVSPIPSPRRSAQMPLEIVRSLNPRKGCGRGAKRLQRAYNASAGCLLCYPLAMIIRRILNIREVGFMLADAVMRERGLGYFGDATVELLTIPGEDGALEQIRVEIDLKDESKIER